MISITFQFVMFSFICIMISWGSTPGPTSALKSIMIALIIHYDMHTFFHHISFWCVKRFLVFSDNRRSTSGRGISVLIRIFVLVISMWCWPFAHMSVSRLPVMWCTVATIITVNKCTSELMWKILVLNITWW